LSIGDIHVKFSTITHLHGKTFNPETICGSAARAVITEQYVVAYGLPFKNKECQQALNYSSLNFWWYGAAVSSDYHFVLEIIPDSCRSKSTI
jgi:hypothetical protein